MTPGEVGLLLSGRLHLSHGDVNPRLLDLLLSQCGRPASGPRPDFAGYEAYAWVGVTSDGAATVTGHVASVNGTSVSADTTLNDVTAAVH